MTEYDENLHTKHYLGWEQYGIYHGAASDGDGRYVLIPHGYHVVDFRPVKSLEHFIAVHKGDEVLFNTNDTWTGSPRIIIEKDSAESPKPTEKSPKPTEIEVKFDKFQVGDNVILHLLTAQPRATVVGFAVVNGEPRYVIKPSKPVSNSSHGAWDFVTAREHTRAKVEE